MIIAIDGPAGAGKSTIATRVARELGLQLIDTGAMYRTVAYQASQAGIPLDDVASVAALAGTLTFEFEFEGDTNVGSCNGVALGSEIRSEEVSKGASVVAQIPRVREALVRLQQEMGRRSGCVMEGRDIGTVVFPQADVKVFLTASPSERARRRVAQLAERGVEADYAQILADIEERDARDSSRDMAPLVAADDATKIDSTAFSIDEVVRQIVHLAQR